jgi:hypothetical protein
MAMIRTSYLPRSSCMSCLMHWKDLRPLSRGVHVGHERNVSGRVRVVGMPDRYEDFPHERRGGGALVQYGNAAFVCVCV